MAKKRIYGEGSVTERGDGRWQVSVPGIDGKRRYGYADNQKDAEKLRRQMLLDVEQRKLPPSKQPFQQHVREWLDLKKRSGGKPNSYLGAVYRMDGRFIPALGDIPLNKLTPAHIQTLYHQMLDEGLSPNTIRQYHETLKVCLNVAVKQRKVEVNPCNHVELPKQVKPKNNFLSQQEALQLLDVVKEHKLFSVLVPLALATEARISELLALSWSDIDFDLGAISIRKTLTKTKRDDGSIGLEIVVAKTESGMRDILLPTFAIEALKKHRSSQIKQALAVGKPNTRNLVFFLFTSQRSYYWPDTVSRMFSKFARKRGFDITFHDLRHTGATLLLESGVDPNEVKERLGHADIRTTLGTYGHVTKKMKDKSRDTLDNLFTEQPNSQNEAM